jgi:copper resistance protein C
MHQSSITSPEAVRASGLHVLPVSWVGKAKFQSIKEDAMRIFLATILIIFGFVSFAAAHAHMEKSVPAPGSTVSLPPKQVEITFSEGVEPKFSGVEVRDAAGKRVDNGVAHQGPGGRHMLTVDLPPLALGSYSVDWHVTSVDSHKSKGSFSFTVAP